MSLQANSGAPMGRRHVEHIRSSLLGESDGFIRCPSIVQVGIASGDSPPSVSRLLALLDCVGCRSANELRDIFEIPVLCLIARPAPDSFKPCNLDTDPPETVLRHALILGLCTAQLFDPRRPVLWTEASLARRLELYNPEGFYV